MREGDHLVMMPQARPGRSKGTPLIEFLRRTIRKSDLCIRPIWHHKGKSYLDEYAQLVSIHDTGQMLAGVIPYIGHLHLDQVHDGPLRPFVVARLKAGRVVCSTWRLENGATKTDAPGWRRRH